MTLVRDKLSLLIFGTSADIIFKSLIFLLAWFLLGYFLVKVPASLRQRNPAFEPRYRMKT